MRLVRLGALLAFCIVLCPAQPVISPDGIANAANYIPGCAGNGGVAQGSIFVVFGSGLGPSQLQQVSAFPLTTPLGGTSIRVTVDGVTVDALPIYTSAAQVAAVLPSRTPVGNGTVTVTYADRTSTPAAIKVVRSAFGIFTINQTGSGPAVAENVDGANRTLNSAIAAARPGQLMILWGTGLGPVVGDESVGPLPSDPPGTPVTVWVGSERARVIYAGRSGCCAGLDQIVFEAPAGIEGCYIPIDVEVGGVHSNYATVALAPASRQCADAAPLIRLGPSKSIGGVLFADVDLQAAGGLSFRGQLIQASFERVPPSGATPGQLAQLVDLFLGGPALPAGSCAVLPPADRDVLSLFGSGSTLPLPLDAGPALTFTGPAGATSVPRTTPGTYSLVIERNFLPQGRYGITNGPGGEVGSFSIAGDLSGAKLTAPASRVSRASDLPVTWSAPATDTSLVAIVGSSSSSACGPRSVAFVCYEQASAGRFVVPRRIVEQLPASAAGGLFGTTGSLILTGVGGNTERTFTASGLDLGYLLLMNLQYRSVSYE